MQTIVLGLNSGLKTAEERVAKKKILLDYLLVHMKQHNMYALRYWFCEALCLVNVVGQLYLMNRFTGGEFFSYGWNGILNHDLLYWPIVVKCVNSFSSLLCQC